MSTRIKVGTYQLGFRWVELFVELNGRSGGSGSLVPGKKGEYPPAHITINSGSCVAYAWGTLVHEVFELAATANQLSFEPVVTFAQGATDCRWFHFDHQQFSEIAQQVGCFLHNCHRDFDRAYRQAVRKKPTLRKRK